MARKKRIAAALIFPVAVAIGLLLYLVGGLSDLERSTLQARFGIRGAQHPKGIVVIAIDDASMTALHQRWPFPRRLHARAIDRLRTIGVKEIVYDVQFTQPTTPGQDFALFDALGRAGGAVLASTVSDGFGNTPVLGGPANLRQIHSLAAWSEFPVTSGGVIERVPYRVEGLKSLALVAATRAGARDPGRGAFGHDGALIDFQGKGGTFPTISFSNLLLGDYDPAVLKGAIAVIGATAPSLQDVHQTPTGSSPMPGPELQANAIWTILHGLPLSSAPVWLGIVLILLAGGVAPFVRLRTGTLRAAGSALGAGGVYVVAAQLLFDGGTVLPVVPPLLALGAGVIGMVTSSEVIEAAERRRLARILYESQLELIHRLGQAAESRDQHTGEHLTRISRLTFLLGKAAGMSQHEAEMLRHASLMHDIGKIGVPDSVLLKAGPLDAGERLAMNAHTDIGGDILSDSQMALVQMSEQVARTHHERWDGTGYPRGLKGEEIPLAGRITSVCDVFDALVTERVYKPPWTVDQTITELKRLSGSAFDPRIVDLFLALIPSLDRDLLGTLAAAGNAPDAPGNAPAGSGEGGEQARVVGDHARHAERIERPDPGQLVDGPDVQLAAGVPDAADKPRRD